MGGPPPENSARTSSPGVQAVESPEIAVRSWEAAYRAYGLAFVAWQRTPENEQAGWQLAVTSRRVAAAWRQIGRVSRTSLWVTAAVDAAALRFDGQAQDWEDEHPDEVAWRQGLRERGGQRW